MNAPRRSTPLLSADIGIGSFDAIANTDAGPERAAVRVRVVDRDTTTVSEPPGAGEADGAVSPGGVACDG